MNSNYIKKHTISDNGFILCDTRKSAIIISLLNRVTMFENSVYAQGKELINFINST